jgi:hypothetical protein
LFIDTFLGYLTFIFQLHNLRGILLESTSHEGSVRVDQERVDRGPFSVLERLM